MRIVSLNAWGGALLDPLLRWLADADPDVVCLQEVTRTPGLTGWTEFADGERVLPQRANLLADVQAALPGYRSTFLPSDAGPVTDGAGGVHRQEFGIAAFIADALPVLGHTSAFVHGAFTEHDAWPTGDRPRTAHALRVLDRAGGRCVTVVHLHGLRDPQGKGDSPSRRAQADRLAALVEQSRGPGDLVVVCGDLNLLPGSATFDVLGRLGLVDLVGRADTRTSLYRKPIRHASYLLVSDRAAVRRFEVLAEPEVSDHRALVLEI